ncbi:MAG: hypothetical protein ACR2P0_15860 [Acidimicrobiales bacterium]
MTDTKDVNVDEALALIDEGLGHLTSRELMSTSEVADLLLDVRVLLASAAERAEGGIPFDAFSEPASPVA